MSSSSGVLIVDDSRVVRDTLARVVQQEPSLHLVGAAADPYEAVAMMRREAPAVILLDLHMPRMDGLTFLEKIMAQHPLPVIVFSIAGQQHSAMAWKALEMGAFEVLEKPATDHPDSWSAALRQLVATIKAAVASPPNSGNTRRPMAVHPPGPILSVPPRRRIIVAGASTGGTEALRVYLQAMPSDAPGMVIVQHMPLKFTALFAERLNEICPQTVGEATDGAIIEPGRVWIAPSGQQARVVRQGSRYAVQLRHEPPVNRHLPSVDVLFNSTAQAAGRDAIGLIFTGMGDDGARGLRAMKEAGSYTIAQDRESCVVFGMPAEAIALGGVETVAPLREMAAVTCRYLSHPNP